MRKLADEYSRLPLCEPEMSRASSVSEFEDSDLTNEHNSVLPARSTKVLHVAGIDTLRIICAVWVVLSHAGGLPLADILCHVAIPERFLHFVSAINAIAFNGVAAVMVFFVISGLCIHLPVVNANRLSPIQFWLRRGLRVGVPLVAAVLLSKLLLGRSSMLEPVLWSLYCELIYYAVYPGLLKLASAIGWPVVLAISAGVSTLTVLAVSNSRGFIWGYGLSLTWVYGLPTWIMGVLLAELIHKPFSTPSPIRIACLRGAVWLASSAATALHFHSSIHYNVSMLIFSPLAFYWVLEEIRASQRRGAPKILEICGQASYSVYLCHTIALAVFILPARIMVYQFGEVWLTCAIFCTAFYFVFERPSHILARTLVRRIPTLLRSA